MIICIFLCSCDTEIDCDYYVINKCSTIIEMQIVDYKNITYNYKISPDNIQYIYHGSYINTLDEDSHLVEYWFKEILIIKDTDTSKVNYIDKNLWKFETISGSHAKYSLTVTPEDFE